MGLNEFMLPSLKPIPVYVFSVYTLRLRLIQCFRSDLVTALKLSSKDCSPPILTSHQGAFVSQTSPSSTLLPSLSSPLLDLLC